MSEHVLKLGRLARGVGKQPFARLGIELAGGVPHGGRFLGRLVSLAFHCVQVEQLGAFHVFQLAQHAHHLAHVVPVERPEIADVHALKDALLVAKGALDGVVQADDALAPVLGEVAFGMQPLRSLEAQTVVSFVGIEVEQVLFHAAHGAIDGHIVVVEHDEQVVGRGARVVEPLESQPSAHRPVADDGHHVSAGMPRPACSHGHAQCGGYAVGGVPAGKRVVFAFQRGGEGAHAAHLAVGAELPSAACKYLVPIGLMAHIPHNAVFGSIENIVQRHRKFHHAKAGGKVAGVGGDLVDDVLTKFPTKFGQLLYAQFSQVGRIFNAAQQVEFVVIH